MYRHHLHVHQKRLRRRLRTRHPATLSRRALYTRGTRVHRALGVELHPLRTKKTKKLLDLGKNHTGTNTASVSTPAVVPRISGRENRPSSCKATRRQLGASGITPTIFISTISGLTGIASFVILLDTLNPPPHTHTHTRAHTHAPPSPPLPQPHNHHHTTTAAAAAATAANLGTYVRVRAWGTRYRLHVREMLQNATGNWTLAEVQHCGGWFLGGQAGKTDHGTRCVDAWLGSNLKNFFV